MSKLSIVDRATLSADRQVAIVDHPSHGRLIVIDGYGENPLHGNGRFWRYGSVHAAVAGDTTDVLSGEWNVFISHIEAIEQGHDTDRPNLNWSGGAIANLMNEG